VSFDQIIHLTPDDDIASLRERLSRTQAQIVILVVSNDVALLRNAVSVKLLRRYAGQMDMQIVVVTRDRTSEDLARRQGLRVYAALDKIPPKSRGGLSKQDLASVPSLPHVPIYRSAARLGCWVLALAVLAAAVAALALVAAFLAPSATITLVPAAEPISATVSLSASTQMRVIDSVKGQFPAKPIQVLIEDTGTVETTGRKRVPDATAAGTVIFVFANRSLGALTIPKGTIVRTASGMSVRFRTEEDVTLPAGAVASVRAQVKAVDPGPNGNVKAGAINIVEGTLAFQVSVLNDEDIGGGTEKQARYVTLQDRSNLREAITQKIHAKAPNELRNAIKPDDILPVETLTLAVNEAIFDKALDAEGEYLSGKVRATVSGLLLDGQDIKHLVAGRLGDQAPPGFVVLPEGVSYGAPANIKYSDGVLNLQITVTARSQAQINSQDAQRAAAAKPLETATEDVARLFRLAQPPEIELKSAWFGRMPIFTSRITVVVND